MPAKAAAKKKPLAAVKRPVGRPRYRFDLEEVRKLARIGCTDAEIAAFCDVSKDTLKRRKKDDPEFCALLEKGREEGKSSLRRMQWKSAESGNITMQIWLGKQLLGQSDKREEWRDVKSTVSVRKADDLTDDELATIIAAPDKKAGQ